MNIWKNRDWTPMLLKEIDKPFNSNDYIFEIKFDGIRTVIYANKKEVRIISRNQKDMTQLFPELQTIKNIVNKNTIFDGEIVTFIDGKPSFSELQKRIHLKDMRKVESISKENPITFMAFDILYENKDLTTLPLLKRKDFLEKYKDTDYFIKTKMINKDGIKLFKSIQKLGLEGIVAKNKFSLYHINKRTDDFIKIKNIQRDEFLIGGYEHKKNGILSLAIGEYIDKDFCFVGNVSINPKHKLYNIILKQKKSKNYFQDLNKDIIYIKPIISCHIKYLERTKNNHLRHPIILDI